ncbi:MAG: ribonuclease Z [Chlamydiales bacterium]|nr:ribonuclease Z [Chlamydiales bacterium]NCF70226.1 ribonuclease Z [Chlamydiales bacterium]
MTVKDLTILGCSSQQPTRHRNHGAYLVRWNNEGLLFDPGEGTQRQFIFANIAPPVVKRIFISHFHGDHCLGLGSMLMRLNLDKVTHPIHCYYPASGKKYFDRLRYSTIYHEQINIVEHPVHEDGIIHEDENFTIEAKSLEHRVDNFGWRIKEKDKLKFDKEKLKESGIKGLAVRELTENGKVVISGKEYFLEDFSRVKKGEVFSVVIDTKECPNAFSLAKDATVLLCESTYLDSERELADKYFHMTTKQAAKIAKQAGAKKLILTHFSARYRDVNDFEEEARQIFPNSYAADDLKVFSFY